MVRNNIIIGLCRPSSSHFIAVQRLVYNVSFLASVYMVFGPVNGTIKLRGLKQL